MPPDKPVPRILQQQPEGESTPQQQQQQQQQQSGSSDAQPQAAGESDGRGQQMGEGSYEGTREYQKDIGEYLKKADVERDAEAAKPRSEQEARELDQAEQEGKSHSKGEH